MIIWYIMVIFELVMSIQRPRFTWQIRRVHLVNSFGFMEDMIYIYIWVNYNNSLTWNKAILGWFLLLTMIPVRSQWGHYNLPRYIYIYIWYMIWHDNTVVIGGYKPVITAKPNLLDVEVLARFLASGSERGLIRWVMVNIGQYSRHSWRTKLSFPKTIKISRDNGQDNHR